MDTLNVWTGPLRNNFNLSPLVKACQKLALLIFDALMTVVLCMIRAGRGEVIAPADVPEVPHLQ